MNGEEHFLVISGVAITLMTISLVADPTTNAGVFLMIVLPFYIFTVLWTYRSQIREFIEKRGEK